MFRTTSKALLRAGFALAVFCSWPPGASIGQTVYAAAAVSPTSVAAGTTNSQMALITNGTIDLGNVTPCEKNCGAQQFGIKPNVGISNIKIIDQTAQELVFTMDIASSAQPGIWTLFVNDASGHEVVALNVEITASSPTPPCTPSSCPPAAPVCTSKGCVTQCSVNCIGGTCVKDKCIHF